jgi:hypothetical protein
VVHVFLVVVNLVREELFNEVLHFPKCGEFKCLLFSLEEDLAVEKTPKDLKAELGLGVLLCSEDFFQCKEELFGIYRYEGY